MLKWSSFAGDICFYDPIDPPGCYLAAYPSSLSDNLTELSIF